MKSNTYGPLLILSAGFLWSFGGLFIKMVPWNAITIAGMRSFFSGIVILIYLRKFRITLTLPVVAGGLCLAATTLLFVSANKLTTAANAIMLQNTAPVFVLILSALVLKKYPNRVDIAVILVTLGGAVLFFIDQIGGGGYLGNICALFAGVTFAGVLFINTLPSARPQESIILGHFLIFFVSLPFIPSQITFEPIPWLSILFLGIFQLGISFLLFSIGIRHTPPLLASLIVIIEPLLNPVWVFIFTGEAPGKLALIGGITIVSAVIFYNIALKRGERVQLTSRRR